MEHHEDMFFQTFLYIFINVLVLHEPPRGAMVTHGGPRELLLLMEVHGAPWVSFLLFFAFLFLFLAFIYP